MRHIIALTLGGFWVAVTPSLLPGQAQILVIDNVDPDFTTTGTWSTGSSATNKWGVDYRFTTTTVGSGGTPDRFCRWTPDLQLAGTYEVAAWWNNTGVPGNNRPTDARYTVTHASGSQTFVVDQEINGGQWNVLGTFTFNAGTGGYVELSNQCETSQAVIADAVRFRFTGTPPAQDPAELRSVWSSRFSGSGWVSETPTDAQAEIDDEFDLLARNNFNCVLFQVRGQCDVLYPSPYEPWSPLISNPDGADPGWDPLLYATAAAHERGLRLHAYFNTHTVWGSATPPSLTDYPTHVYHQHPEWLLYDDVGAPYGNVDGYFWMNPGVPAADAWVRREAMHLVQTYDIDGLHFDRVRLPQPGLGRNPIAVARWDNLATPASFDGPGNPENLDWDAFMRDSITRHLINICGEAWSIDPAVLLSSAPLGLWDYSAYSSIGGYIPGMFYGYVRGQDAKAWMQMGAQDFIVPQIYWFDAGNKPDFTDLFNDWWAAAQAAGRQLVPGCRNGVNTGFDGSLTVAQRQAYNEAQALAARSAGALGYNLWHVQDTLFTDWSTAGHPYDSPAPYPPASAFPWRQTEGVICGRVYESNGTSPAVDTWITRNGSSWTALASGDGFYAFLRVPPGTYTLQAQYPGSASSASAAGVVVTAGQATVVNLVLSGLPATLTQFAQD